MQSKLVAFKIFRRLATAAIFSERGLEFVDLKHLSNDPAKASETLKRFVLWTIENFRPELCALARDEDDKKPRAGVLSAVVENLLLAQGIPVWKVTDKELFASYATPSLTKKHELRNIARSLWPQIPKEQESALDAALAGLFVQTERLLSHH